MSIYLFLILLQAKPDVDPYGAKRKAGKPPTIDDNHHSGFSVEKKPKREWSCGLCQITTTNEKGLNNHLEGKKHKAKASLRTKKIGLDARLDGQKLQRGITSTNIGILEPRKEDQVVQNSQGLGGLDNENEIATSKETGHPHHCNPLFPPTPMSPIAHYKGEFASGGFPSNVLAPRVFLMVMSVNVDKEFQ
ncbi:hypothetical protein D0Y65_004565 [Glycine soja]|uniref:U1-type domain-containing protein n=1 Tax=Glycine soja TaxID=3848 RepID=A0A445LRW7_GLYSO|nr:hypothetical protein D0Y65_004565 [Glycine soja]